MIPDLSALLVIPILGLALGATVALLPRLRPRWIALAIVALFAVGPLAFSGRTPPGQPAGLSLWEWTVVGGASVQAAYHADPLAVIAAAVVALSSGAALFATARSASPLATALLAALGIVLIALVAVTDVVFATLVAGTAAALAVAAGLFVAPAAAVARLAALLAVGVQALIAAALLLARGGVASFELGDIAPDALTPAVALATVFGAAVFCGLYPFVPWRYERSSGGPRPAAPLRGIALFATGFAGTVLMFRFVAASQRRPDELRLPELGVEWHAAVAALALVLSAVAVRAAPPSARRGRALTGAVFVILALALPLLTIAHVMILLAVLTVVYATVASAALVDEWGVARFDVRLAVLWAAFASGSSPALAAAIFGVTAASLALVLEPLALPKAVSGALATAGRLLDVIGPVLALAGVAFAPDPITGVLAGAVLAWAATLEIAHAVRESNVDPRLATTPRIFAALAAVAVVLAVALVGAVPAAGAAVELLGPLPAEGADLVLAGLALLAAALAVVLVTLPDTITVRVSGRTARILGRVLTASDPVPALMLAYGALEAWSERSGALFASFEDRAGVWFAGALLALIVVWAATS